MSLFLAGFQTSSSNRKKGETILASLGGQLGTSDSVQQVSGHAFVTRCAEQKVIPDIFTRDETTDSWILVVGNPILPSEMESDPGKFLQRFLADPVNILRRDLDGQFALLAHDGVGKRFLAAGDLNTSLPIFYTVNQQGALFSSHELGLARLLAAEIEPAGFAQALFLGRTWGADTRFRGLSKLRPGELLIVDADLHLHREYYWTPAEESVWKGDFDTVLDRWSALLAGSMQMFLQRAGGCQVQTDLTAGEDARLLLAQLHALGVKFRARVAGQPADQDVLVAREAADKLGLELQVEPARFIGKEQLLSHALHICVETDGYDHFFKACHRFATLAARPVATSPVLHFAGFPGGEAFRGSYYLRGRLIFPGKSLGFDPRFFTRMKFLLDYQPGLLRQSDSEFLEDIHGKVAACLADVAHLPDGTKVDHIIRLFQSSLIGLWYRYAMILPLGTRDITRSIYNLSPGYKSGGRLTKACTENLYPELARIRTQNGVPTVRRRLTNLHLFLPEYTAMLRRAINGFNRRVLRLQKSAGNLQGYLRLDHNAPIFTNLLNNPPYSQWFASSGTMCSGDLYQAKALEPILSEAREGRCRNLSLLAAIINQELACRWVQGTEAS